MQGDPEASLIDNIVELANQIIDECLACAGRASEIAVWARQIRERRPSREELAALVDATCKGFLPADQRELLINGLRALVRLAE